MKQALPRLWGNDALRARFGNDILARRLSHAYILEGKYGLGKHTLALQLAAAQSCLAKDDEHAPLPCGTCKNCKKILEGKSPDVTIIGREKGKVQITVDAVRHLRTDVLTAPNDLDTKVYIIEDAHAMNQQAQNALLLTLEEPPAYVLFLLLCEDASNLLETIRSRAPIYRLQSLPLDTVRQYVTQHTPPGITLPPEDKLEQLLMAADGSIGKRWTSCPPSKVPPFWKQDRQLWSCWTPHPIGVSASFVPCSPTASARRTDAQSCDATRSPINWKRCCALYAT